MNGGQIGTRYANALLKFAMEKKQADLIYQEAKAISNSYSQFPKLKSVIENPVMISTEKRKIIVLAAGGELSDLFDKFFDLLFANNRECYLQAIVLKYIDLYRQQNNIHYGKLTTSTDLNASIETNLIEMIKQNTGGTLEVEKVIDPSILGGFVLELDFVRWDASLSSQLNSIRKQYLRENKNII